MTQTMIMRKWLNYLIHINNVDKKLKSAKSIKEENDALAIRNASLKKQIIVKDEEIDDLKKENSSLTNELKNGKISSSKLLILLKIDY